MEDKVKSRDELVALREKFKAEGKTVGFTSGVFDIMHAGHAEYLAEAKSRCDILIVAVNSDSSVRQNKGPTRPIVSERERAFLVAALAAVDYVFIFSELNNNKNIEALKPDFYIKAGDYTPEKLSSTPLVRSYGGEIIIVPFKSGFSSTSIIEKIQRQAQTVSLKFENAEKSCKAVFLDRDGTLIEEIGYLHDPDKVKEIPGSFAALKRLQDAGFKLIVVTNQPGIGFGYFSEEDFYKTNKEFLRQVSAYGVKIDKIYFCPHTAAAQCECRKPKTAFLERAKTELGVIAEESYMVGDTLGDIQFAKNGGLTGILVESGVPVTDDARQVADFVAKDMAEAADVILKNS